MRSRMIATAAVSAAFVLIPVGGAFAGSGPATSGSGQSASDSTAPSAKGNPNSARAQAADVCGDAHQIGETGYVKKDGETIASVKQFYSKECNENYSYVWLWESFTDKYENYDVSASVYSYTNDQESGKRTWTLPDEQEFWSNPTDTAKECTAAKGTVRMQEGAPITHEGMSDKRC